MFVNKLVAVLIVAAAGLASCGGPSAPSAPRPPSRHVLPAAVDPLDATATDTSPPSPSATPIATPTVPEPTPASDGCQRIIIPTDAMSEVAGAGSSFPPPFASCNDPGDSAEASLDAAAESFARRTLLLSWNAQSSIR